MARADSIGMFWEDIPSKGARGERVNIMPPIPDTGWLPPAAFPDLSAAPVIAIDCETYDPDLNDYGPGWARGVGHIVGVSVAVPGFAWYFPIRHEVEPEHNLDAEHVLAWLRVQLGRAHQPKVGANIIYDIGWLAEEGVPVTGKLYDVQHAEALLEERGVVALDWLGTKYLNRGKVTNLLYDWCYRFYGGSTTDQRKNIYRAPPRLVGPYAEADAEIPLQVINHQWAALEREGLLDLFSMECRLIPLLVKMRQAGVRVNISAAEKLRETLAERCGQKMLELERAAGQRIDVYAADSIARAFDKFNVPYPRTATGKPSFRKQFLESVTHPIADMIKDVRRLEKLGGTFVQSYILDSNIRGMLYGEFHLLRNDSSGTRSGRLSSSNPNLQNIPARDEEIAPLIRGLYIPDEGHARWRRYDYSQIEYRGLVHFAVGPGSEEARARYNNDPDTDYHEMTLDLMAPKAGWDVSTPALRKKHRKPIKGINFGLIYGMGVPALAAQIGVSVHEGRKLFKAYHAAVPFALPTMEHTVNEAQRLGYITTILGRRSRFDMWEPEDWDSRDVALSLDAALDKYPGKRLIRAHTHKALNRRLQGSAADIMKCAMLACYEDGVFDHTGVPRLTVHDELDFSDPGGVDDGFAYIKHRMETALPLRIPVIVDEEVGPDWGHAE